ncbi:TIGR02452 family protein [Micromonospora sp. NBC_01740]|uniref:TIGR02452 family protein n=1 Tax=Micromonospora sp. NBC_01740 TaxID=2975986 RepID=UPI002E10DF06|nr:TIGR02452 family protein [Micromonospora sp. NBC_01740]
MSSRLREIARQTVAIAESGRYRNGAGDEVVIGAQVRAAVAGTRHHLPDGTLTIGDTRVGAGDVEVTYQSTLQAARRLGPDAACLVFASAKNPGGGFLGGAKAQEESVARSSALYPCLLAAPDFYAFHRGQRDLRYSDRIIYSPGVPVFRDDKGGLLDVAYQTSFLTAAAPNLGAIVRNQPAHAPDVPAVLRRRARRVLEVAAAHGHRTIVLGAWGCGVFRNDPATVADAFADALRMVDRFDRVVFAIRDNLSGTPVYGAFAERFGTSAPEPAGDARRG